MLQRGLRLNTLMSNSVNNKSSRITAVLSIAALSVVLGGCNRFSISNGSMDYKNAQSIAPVQIPDQFKTRQIAPLYPVPVVPSNSASAALVISNSAGNVFVVPKPKPLNEAIINVDQVGDGTPSPPQLVIDGNGYPILKISGDPLKIWDIINTTLSVANVEVKQRNAAANRFDIVIDQTAYQLRLGRIGNITTATLQKSDDSLADKTTATELLQRITQNWSASS